VANDELYVGKVMPKANKRKGNENKRKYKPSWKSREKTVRDLRRWV
jgi:hypothetical protein